MIVFIAHNLAPIMFVSMVAFMLIGYPIAFSLAANGLLFFGIGLALAPYAPGEITLSPQLLQILPDRVFSVMSNEILLALPFFTFMGLVLERSGMAEDLLNTVGEVFGGLPGGLAFSVVFVGALLAATTGVVAASIIAMGLISLPVMMRYGYSRPVAAGTIVAAGTLAQIIPPSIVLIVLADQLGRPVGDMYQGALLPGLMLAGLYAVWVALLSVFRPGALPGLPEEALSRSGSSGGRGLRETGLLFALSALTAIVLVRPIEGLGAMDAALAGISVGALVAFIASFMHRRVGQNIPRAFIAFGVALALGFAARDAGYSAAVALLADTLAVALGYVAVSALLQRVAGVSLSSELGERVAFALVPPLLLIFLVLGTIFIGLATPTEGGAMGAIGALILASVKRRLERNPDRMSLAALASAAEATARISAFVMFILIGARIFSMTFYAVNGHIWIEDLLTSFPGGRTGFLLFVLGTIFLLGFFLEFFEIAFVVVPLVVPAAVALDIDLIWFGVMLALVVQTSYLTPPLGFGLFFLRSVAPAAPYKDPRTGRTMPGLSTMEIYRGVVPFIIIQLVAAGLIISFPELVTHYKSDNIALDPATVESDILNIPLPGFD